MARIRSIKPEFWTDEKVVKLPFEARLVFIGMWNFADDEGYLPDEPERLQLQILPGDQVDMHGIIDLLCAAELLDRIDLADGTRVLRINGFVKHQKISHASPSRLSAIPGKKVTIPASVRRAVATKYGCQPGGELVAACYHCGSEGRIWWQRLYSGRPGAWVAFSGLELDHFIPESSGGQTSAENIVLSCRYCNRSRNNRDPIEFATASLGRTPEKSGALQPDMEGKGIEGNKKEEGSASAPASEYAFEGEIIRLKPRDFAVWQQTFRSYPDLAAELRAIDARLVEQRHEGKWFAKVSGWLRTGHEARMRSAAPPISDADQEVMVWRSVLTAWQSGGRKRGAWPENRGVPPGVPGCRVPENLLVEFGMPEAVG